MAVLDTEYPTLLDFSKHLDPDGKVGRVAEVLTRTNEFLETMVWQEGNLLTGNRGQVRKGIPTPTWTKLYGRVKPTKGTVEQVVDTCGTMEAWSEVACRLADLGGNAEAFRWRQDKAHIIGMGHELASTMIYGNDSVDEAEFTGLAARFNDLDAESGDNILQSAGTPSHSMFFVVWGDQTCHGIFPKGSKAGLEVDDEGKVTSENSDGLLKVYRTHFMQQAGLAVPDWRGIVRFQYDQSALTKDAASGADLIDLMTQAEELVPGELLSMGKPQWLVNRTAMSFLRRQIVNKVASSTLRADEVAGKRVTMFGAHRVSRCDALATSETAIA